MRPLLCPSPVILDQNFPRSSSELYDISAALAAMHDGLVEGTFGIILPDTFVLFIEAFDWNRTGPIPLLRDIYRILESWLVRCEGNVLKPCLPSAKCGSHPLPCDCADSNEAALWAEELAKLLKEHDTVCTHNRFFIGVASHKAFAGVGDDTYCPEPQTRCFPLVGPREVNQLDHYWNWEIPQDLHQHKVSFASAHDNAPLLGGKVEKPHGGSHYRVTFPGGRRPWILDRNDDPQEDSRIAQIVDLTNYSFDYIKFVLLFGAKPRLIGKFDSRLCC